MVKMKFFLIINFLFIFLMKMKMGNTLTITKGAYKNIVVTVEDTIPFSECQTVLLDLEASLTSASSFLFSALDGKVFMGSIIIIIPQSWTQNCLPINRTLVASSGEKSDITVINKHPIYKDNVWTLQYGDCGEQGDQIYLPKNSLKRNKTIGKELVREWAKYRYGIFDEKGYSRDPIYPKCYSTDRKHVTGCSDSAVFDYGNCDEISKKSPNLTEIIDKNSRSSIMFTTDVESIVLFCDEDKHNRLAPTKHNHMCNRRSTLDIILKHNDFLVHNHNTINYNQNTRYNYHKPSHLQEAHQPHSHIHNNNNNNNFNNNNQQVTVPLSTIVNTEPIFMYKQKRLTRYILIIDETQDMLIRESWTFLRNAIRKWIVYDLSDNTEVGIVLANDTNSTRIQKLITLNKQKNRDQIASSFPYSPSDTRQQACIKCAIKESILMLNERLLSNGPANNVILIIAPGVDNNLDYRSITTLANINNIRLTTINYPGVVKRQPLDILSQLTNGLSYTIFEQKYNGEKSYLTTYFELTNILYNIGYEYYEGNKNDLPIEIHRKELVDITDDINLTKRKESREVTGSFVLDNSMGSPSDFFVYTHNTDHPLIHVLKLVSPTQLVYSTSSDLRLFVKQLTIPAFINETGSWTYTIKRYIGNPQSHYVQVMATPRNYNSPVIRARAWIKRTTNGIGPIRIYAEIKKGNLPVQSAQIEVTVTRPDQQCNITNECKEKFLLLDTGSGDPDITKGDGIYSRYFSASTSGPGTYRFEITVTDHGNTAYTLAENDESIVESCCGSVIPTPTKQPLPSCQRVLPPITVFFTKEQLEEQNVKNIYGRIGDLRADIIHGTKVRLTWTSPDMGGKNVARYEVKYTKNLNDIIDNYETGAILWTHDTPFVYAIGDDTTFTMNFTAETNMIGNIIYIAIHAYSQLTKDALPGPISNYIRVYIPTIPTSTISLPTYHNGNDFGDDNLNNNEDDTINNHNIDNYSDENNEIIPKIINSYDLNLELIIPIIVGTILLLSLIIVYCYFCIIKRRNVDEPDNPNDKKKLSKSSQHNNHNSDHDIEQQPQPDYDDDDVIVKTDKIAKSINIIVPSPSHHSPLSSPTHHLHLQQQQQQQRQQTYLINGNDLPDPLTIGLPIYDDDYTTATITNKKRFSLVNHQDQHMVEELKYQHNNLNNCGLSIISSSNNTTLTRNNNNNNINNNNNCNVGNVSGIGRALSPYESWTASQLLHEHERRHSPMDDMINQSLINQQADQISLINGQSQHYNHHHQQNSDPRIIQISTNLIGQHQLPPPVPPLPYITSTIPSNATSTSTANNQYYQQHQSQRNPLQLPSFNNPSLQGSMCSVNSGDKKRRNVTMV